MEVVLVALSWFLSFIWLMKWVDLVFKAHTRLNIALQLLEQVIEKRRSMRSKEPWTERSNKNPKITLTELCRSRWRTFQINNLNAALRQFWSIGQFNEYSFGLIYYFLSTQLFVCFFPFLCDLGSCSLVNKVVSSGFQASAEFRLWRRAWSLLSFYHS